MIEEHILETDRNIFSKHARDFWTAVGNKKPKQANRETKHGDAIVSRYARKGAVSTLLLPLLKHDEPAVRFAAAAHLLNHDAKEEAVLVLRSLVTEPVGLIKSSARLTLMRNSIPLDAQPG